MNYKIAVCDDEKIFVDDLTEKIKSCGNEYEIYLIFRSAFFDYIRKYAKVM